MKFAQSEYRSNKSATLSRDSATGRCRRVVSLVARERGVSVSDIMAPTRSPRPIACARQLAMYLCHVLLGLNLTEVGARFGRDRTTVAYACSLIEDSRECPERDAAIAALEAMILADLDTASPSVAKAQGDRHATA